MKKIMALALAFIMVFTLCACGGGKSAADYVMLDEALGTESYAIGFRQGDDNLCAMVESALVALVKDGTYDEIGQKYPDIYDFLSLSADTVEDVAVPEGAAEEYGAGFVFKHGFDLDYPPYSYLKDDGTVGGFDVELCQAVCAYLGWEYQAVPFNWDAKDAELNSGSCDCIWSGFTVEGREDDYCWSMAYSNNTQVILVAGDSGIKSLSDLAGKKVGVQTATSAYDLLQEDQAELAGTFGDLLVYETYTIAFNDLEAGAVDAIAIDQPVAQYLISGAK